ncbi:hypothetical protein [Paenibacillus hubeiensis]|uniref:hypothetical protein n=1 Tax=Paenibacillus hubeiensis TaxID=3077330 RepID=UPI0031BA5A97
MITASAETLAAQGIAAILKFVGYNMGELAKKVMHDQDRVEKAAMIDFYTREGRTHCKHLVLRVSAHLGGHYILAIHLDNSLSIVNLLKPEWQQFKEMCMNKSIQVTDHDKVLCLSVGFIAEVPVNMILGR